jgi:hypothetical protein
VGELALKLCLPAADAITGQLFCVRGRELFVFSQSRPAGRTTAGDPAALAPHFAPLETDLEAFNTEPAL